jgi:subtilisin family serine protease
MTQPDDLGGGLADAGARVGADEYTGRYITLLDQADTAGAMSSLAEATGVAPAEQVSAAEPEAVAQALDAGANVVLEDIGVAIVSAEPDQRQSLMEAASAAPQVLAIERERRVSIFPEQLTSADYLRGFQAGVDAAVTAALSGTSGAGAAAAAADEWDETRATWGLQAVRVLESCLTGEGVRVAVLDTGVDLTHRDLVGRSITTASFIAGEDVQDGHGHGTHCIGTSCGTATPSTLPRYGIAGSAQIYAGKVLSNAGSGADGGILAGINWAVAQGCRVVSMSLGAPTKVGDTYSRVYEQVALRALERGTIIVAAAGNESHRPDVICPVGHPANCPSILAVAALARDLSVAWFSSAGLNPDGGQVDIAAPGVDVLSSWPEPLGYRRIAGTSMATPHVAGVLALLTQANPTASPAQLKNTLSSSARRLTLPATDVGSGLVQAP